MTEPFHIINNVPGLFFREVTHDLLSVVLPIHTHHSITGSLPCGYCRSGAASEV